jgi:hypothetical protein
MQFSMEGETLPIICEEERWHARCLLLSHKDDIPHWVVTERQAPSLRNIALAAWLVDTSITS